VTVSLLRPAGATLWAEARRLIEEYAASLPVDLAFQNFAEELERLPAEYGPPRGAFLLAEAGERHIGCVGLREFDGTTGEVKRLYVVPASRGSGAGRALARGIVSLARDLGYRRLVLDTLPTMGDAQRLYRSLGFAPIAPYRFNPVEGAAYLELRLH
jgi:GNAT superfamily N-acetyltransferase